MTNEELKKLSRAELLEILLRQQEKIEALETELQDAKKALEERQIRIDESGSLAEAALRISHVFEAAQQAADLYLENVKLRAGEAAGEAEARRQAETDWAEQARAQRLRVAQMLAAQEKEQQEMAQQEKAQPVKTQAEKAEKAHAKQRAEQTKDLRIKGVKPHHAAKAKAQQDGRKKIRKE